MPAGAMEQVLNKPLSGSEIKQIVPAKVAEAVAEAVRDRLERDGRMSDWFAFPAFRFRGDFVIVLSGAVHDEIKHTVEGGAGSVVDNRDAPAAHVMVHAEQGETTPNQARVEAGLDVPVLTHDAKGRQVEKGVKYGKEQAKKVAERTGR
jgi:hypothetical protein